MRIFGVFYQWKITEDSWNIWIGCGSNGKVDCLPTTRSQSLVPPVHVSRYPWGRYKSLQSISDCVNAEKSGSSMVVTTVASQQERSHRMPFCGSLCVLPVSVWVLSAYSGFLPPPKDLHGVRLTDDAQIKWLISSTSSILLFIHVITVLLPEVTFVFVSFVHPFHHFNPLPYRSQWFCMEAEHVKDAGE